MYSKFYHRNLFFSLTLLIIFAMSGCSGITKFLHRSASGGFAVKDGKILHVKQVLENYDNLGQSLPQYYELWLADKKGLCVEIDIKGNEIMSMMDTDDMHIAYDSKTKEAVKYNFSQIFILDFKALKSSYSKTTQADDCQYVERNCSVYLLENDNSDEWMKLYVDKETGFVLLCDAPLFRIRTALLEVIPMDGKLFTVPSDIKYK